MELNGGLDMLHLTLNDYTEPFAKIQFNSMCDTYEQIISAILVAVKYGCVIRPMLKWVNITCNL